jgi:hypothetical protein
MAKQTFTTGQVLTAAQMTNLQQTAMGGGSPVTKTTSYVLVAADAGTVIQMNSASSTTITVNTALFAAGDSVQIQNIGAGICTITAGTATVTTAGSLALTQWEGGVLYFTSTSASIFFDYIQAGVSIPLTTKGDLFGYDTANARIPIGTNGQVLTADSTQSLGLKWATAGSSYSGVSLYKSADQSYASGSGVNMTFDTELFDTDAFHSTSSNTDRITIPTGKAGYYLLSARTIWAAGATGQRISQIRKNAGATSLARIVMNNQTAAADATAQTSCVVNLAVADYVFWENYQDGTGALNATGGGQQYSAFSATYLGA